MEHKVSPEELKIMQNYPLEIKVAKTRQRIREWVSYFGIDNVYISFSGGKDSTVLLDIARKDYPDIKAVFCDTGLEHPEIREFVNTYDNVDIIRPSKSFREVIKRYGYPVISKEQSKFIHAARQGKPSKLRTELTYLIDAPFEVSDYCCYHLKKSPFMRYHTKTKRVPIIAMLASESRLRFQAYLNTGCNNYDSKIPTSKPMSFWTDDDVLEYIEKNNLRIATCYGFIKQNLLGRYYMDGLDRTGCIFCAYGAHLEPQPNRYKYLKRRHPELYDYCINGGEYVDGLWQPNKDGLGFGKVLDYIGVEY